MKTFRFFRILSATLTCLLLGVCLLPVPARAAGFPDGPIVIISPYAPGDAVDNTARTYAEALGKKLGTSAVVQNIPGGSGVIGLKNVLKAKPDGQTLGMAVGGSLINAPMISKPGFGVEDFTPIAKLAELPFALAVSRDSSHQNLDDFIRAGRQRSLKIATPGANSTQRMVITDFAARNGMKPIQHVAGQGGGDTVTKLLTGEVDASFTTVPVFYPLVTGGRLRLLGVGTDERLAYLPDAPTFSEQGYAMPDTLWIGLVSRNGVPADTLRKLAEATRTAAEDPALRDALDRFRIRSAWSGPEAFRDLIARDADARRKVMREIGLIRD